MLIIRRYKILSKNYIGKSVTEYQGACKSLINALAMKQENYQIGVTKVFLRQDQFITLEQQRHNLQMKCAILIQKRFRGWSCRSYWKKLKSATKEYQRRFRGYIIRNYFINAKKSSLLLQSLVRKWNVQNVYIKKKKATTYVQSMLRMVVIRRLFLDKQHCRIIIQAEVHRFIMRNYFKSLRNSSIILQTAIRCHHAQIQLEKAKKSSPIAASNTLQRGIIYNINYK